MYALLLSSGNLATKCDEANVEAVVFFAARRCVKNIYKLFFLKFTLLIWNKRANEYNNKKVHISKQQQLKFANVTTATYYQFDFKP